MDLKLLPSKSKSPKTLRSSSDLKLVVRYETDGYIDDASSSADAKKTDGDDDLTSLINTLSLGPSASSTASPVSAKSKLMIKKEGKVVPIKSTLEIKTRTVYKPIDVQEVFRSYGYVKLLSSSAHITRKVYSRYRESKMSLLTSSDGGGNHQADLKKLATLIKKIISVVKENGGKGVVKYHIDQGDKLATWQSDGKKLLPDDLYSKLDSKKPKESELEPIM
ncbi:hypothetical protein EIK77_008906 [Talaromyces pinophilus]|nr:hypothetical protein EIK77_008906 [Talaromyces pinophilus]